MDRRLRLILAAVIGAMGVLMTAGVAGSIDSGDFAAAGRYFSIAEIVRSRSYFIHGMVPVMVLRMAVFALLAFAVLKEWNVLPLCVRERVRNVHLRNSLTLFAVLVFLELLQFPVAFYAGFVREGNFGLRNAGFPLWLYRYVLSSLISLFVTWVMLSVCARVLGGRVRFMVFIPVVFFVVSLGATVLFPRVVTPLFYEVTSLENSELRGRIQGLMEQTGLPVSDVRVVHTGRYSKKANAYFTGFGSAREIYLYDTLLQDFSGDEIMTIVAHELGHYREEHVLIGLLLVSAGIAAALGIMALLSRYVFGGSPGELVLRGRIVELMFLLMLMLFIAKPVFSTVSRYMERRADGFALRRGSPETFISLKVKFAKKNIAHLAPNPLYVWFYDTHPPVMERIRRAERVRAFSGRVEK
ncbi:MAG TPA: M48 family metalloprotease [Spirochaetota bacterium]|nr:M48 family metalloprotease [Spirochaetota bacterium]HQP49630.1 M48 family metalloprotease [Spirochaetota bacterium]